MNHPPLESPENSNLKTSLSCLKSLIQEICQCTTSSSSSCSTIPCPFNPHHHIPPQSLFSHSLHCQTPSSSSSFFYQNCPSVVSLVDIHKPPPTPTPTFTLPPPPLPFFQNPNPLPLCQSSLFPRLLPSEYVFLKTETHAWIHDYPLHYSSIIRRLFLSLASSPTPKVVMDAVSTWVLVNSPRYGLIIHLSLRDHVVFLFNLCLRGILSEALALGNAHVNQFYFNCPVLCQLLACYATQLGILFGDINAKLFAIHLLKHFILNLANNFLMFTNENIEFTMDTVVSHGEISVSQVKDALAAFYHRSLLEQKIKAFNYSTQLSCSQRVAEHEYISKRAEEERHKRPDFKPIIEHDLFSWQRGRNKDTSVTKSREELLAEERDYKRRRMSYRGKKIKRTTTQVMRDIIEEYTAEIKEAGGFGHLQHVAEESGKAASDSLPVCTTSADNVMEKGLTNLSDVRSAPTYNRIKSHSYEETRSTKLVDPYPLDKFKLNQKADTNRYDRNYSSRSPKNLRNNGRTGTIEQNSVRGRREVTDVRRELSRRNPERNHRSSCEHRRHRKERFNGTEDKSRHERSLGRSLRSDSGAHDKFKDRYDPSESWNTDEDNP